jgi:hypothetical protein
MLDECIALLLRTIVEMRTRFARNGHRSLTTRMAPATFDPRLNPKIP